MITTIRKYMQKQWGWALVILAFFLGCITLYWGTFIDEADNLAVGSMVAQGSVLYRDVFSHHFPFVYFWGAAIIKLAGHSMLWMRFSVWFFQVLCFVVAISLSGYHKSLGIAILVWSLIRRFYFANMVIYNSFAAGSLVVVFAITLAGMKGDKPFSWRRSAVVGLFAGIALLSDPLSVYSIGIALIFLWIKNFRNGFIATLFLAGFIGISISYLVIIGALNDFIDNAIVFNINVYGKYFDANPQRISELVSYLLNGLGITERNWSVLAPLKNISIFKDGNFDSWLFTGFSYRLAFITNLILFIAQKKWREGIFVYSFAAALLIIYKWDFRSQPFVLVALIVIGGLITQELGNHSQNQMVRQKVIYAAISGFFMVSMLWLNFRVIGDTAVNLDKIFPSTNFGALGKEAVDIKALTCGQDNVYLSYYPGGTYVYWFMELRSASRYLYMWPWVAEVAQKKAFVEISSHPFVIVVMQDTVVWVKYDTKVYLHPFEQELIEQFIHIKPDIYISPALAKRCKTKP